MILTLTMNPCIDKSSTVEKLEPNSKLRCEKPRHEPGGGGINVSRAIKVLGGESLAVYPKGGANGELLRLLIEEEKISQCPVDVEHLTRENIMIYDRSRKHQYRFIMPGTPLSEAEWTRVLRAVEDIRPEPDYLILSGSLPEGVPPDFYARLIRRPNFQKSRVILDTSGEPLRAAAAENCFLIKPNRRELGSLVNRDLASMDDLREAAAEVIGQKRCEVIVVSLGHEGVLFADSRSMDMIVPPEVPLHSPVGAGDSMVAGIIHALNQGKTIREAAMFGVAAGTAAVMTPGTELCRKEDVDRLYQEIVKTHTRES